MWAMSAPNAPSPPTLNVRNLTVERGGRTLFSKLSFAVAGGGLVLLRGPNGAGKTSLLLALAGVLHPKTGGIDYRAGDASTARAALTHLVLAQNGVKGKLTVAENLRFWRAVNGPDGAELEVAIERVGLGGLDGIEAGHLSTGQQRRLALARLLVSRRAIWLLDEPTAALDAEGEALVGALIAEHLSGGGLAIVATHHDLAVDPTETITLGGLA
jgi:heme exporter protein A